MRAWRTAERSQVSPSNAVATTISRFWLKQGLKLASPSLTYAGAEPGIDILQKGKASPCLQEKRPLILQATHLAAKLLGSAISLGSVAHDQGTGSEPDMIFITSLREFSLTVDCGCSLAKERRPLSAILWAGTRNMDPPELDPAGSANTPDTLNDAPR